MRVNAVENRIQKQLSKDAQYPLNLSDLGQLKDGMRGIGSQCDANQATMVPAQISELLTKYEPISLAEMEGVALLDRTDTKFVMRVDNLMQVLAHLTEHYRVLEIAEKRMSGYANVYFDTENLDLYRNHHNGKLNRYKVRTRDYVDSDLAFHEVKFKTNTKRTVKSRMQLDAETVVESDTAAFLNGNYPFDEELLVPSLGNRFTRITLVSNYAAERVTLDLNITYFRPDAETGALQPDKPLVSLPGVVIAEVKQARASHSSDFIKAIHRLGIRPSKFSKYCIGIVMLYDQVKSNNFKPILLRINKIMQGQRRHANL